MKIWHPHVNHLLPKKVSCFTIAQRTLRDSGLIRMGDVLEGDGTIISWAAARARGIPTKCQGAFTALVDNLATIPELDDSPTLHEFYLESIGLVGEQRVWKFMLTAAHCHENWLPFLDRTSLTQAFVCRGQSLCPSPLQPPGPDVRFRRIVVHSNGGHKLGLHGGTWTVDNTLLTQYCWKGGTQLTDYATSSIPLLQNPQQARDHPAIRKWENQLNLRLPEHVWHNTWLPFRSAKENTFLWLILFRAIATLSWVFPNLPHADSVTHCPRCNIGAKEDILHCL